MAKAKNAVVDEEVRRKQKELDNAYANFEKEFTTLCENYVEYDFEAKEVIKVCRRVIEEFT